MPSDNSAPPIPEDISKAVILAYFDVTETGTPDTSLSIENFTTQLEDINSGSYTVLPLPEIIGKIERNEELPPHTLGITFDGAMRSSYENAMRPLLEKHIPFTVFYAADSTDANTPDYLSWKELKDLSARPEVTLGVLPTAYEHLSHKGDTEILTALNKARQKHREELGAEAAFLAYPYGEHSPLLEQRAKTQGFQAAFTLRSGAVFHGQNAYTLPRFTMTDRYGNIERFRMVANALPLPVSDLEPQDPRLNASQWFAGFTLPESLSAESDTLSCFISGQPAPKIQKLGRRIEIRPATPVENLDRLRLNCTMAGPRSENDTEQWRWLGMLYHRPATPSVNETAANRITELPSPPPDELPEPRE